MSGEIRVTPPTPNDVLLAAKAFGYPPLQGEGLAILPGEEAWRAAVTPETAALVWETLRTAELEEARHDEDGDG